MRDVPFAVAALVSFLCIAGLDALPATAAEKTTAVAATSERTQVFRDRKNELRVVPGHREDSHGAHCRREVCASEVRHQNG